MDDAARIIMGRLALLAGETPDRVPWFGDLAAYWAYAMEIRGEVSAGWQRNQEYYDFYRELGLGFYLQGYWAFSSRTDSHLSIDTREQNGCQVQLAHTPLGTLREEARFLPERIRLADYQHLDSGRVRCVRAVIRCRIDRGRQLVGSYQDLLCFPPRHGTCVVR